MSFWWMVAIFLVIAIVGAIVSGVLTDNKKKELVSEIETLDDFTPTQHFMGADGNSGIAIDETRRKICLIRSFGSFTSKRVLPYQDVIASEIAEDGESITKTMRSSQIGGAVVGAVLLGGVGALIGGLSGKTKTKNTVKRIELQISLNDTSNPIHNILFLNIETNRDGIVYKSSFQSAQRWHGIVAAVIRQADADAQSLFATQQQPSISASGSSLADELKKLADLHSAGILTKEEFHTQKAKILNAA